MFRQLSMSQKRKVLEHAQFLNIVGNIITNDNDKDSCEDMTEKELQNGDDDEDIDFNTQTKRKSNQNTINSVTHRNRSGNKKAKQSDENDHSIPDNNNNSSSSSSSSSSSNNRSNSSSQKIKQRWISYIQSEDVFVFDTNDYGNEDDDNDNTIQKSAVRGIVLLAQLASQNKKMPFINNDNLNSDYKRKKLPFQCEEWTQSQSIALRKELPLICLKYVDVDGKDIVGKYL